MFVLKLSGRQIDIFSYISNKPPPMYHQDILQHFPHIQIFATRGGGTLQSFFPVTALLTNGMIINLPANTYFRFPYLVIQVIPSAN